MSEFRDLQTRLGVAYAANTVESTTSHTVVVLPSFSLGESLLSHYANRLPALEHRFLVCVLMLRMPAVRIEAMTSS